MRAVFSVSAPTLSVEKALSVRSVTALLSSTPTGVNESPGGGAPRDFGSCACWRAAAERSL
jgi:hypothetical protein